MDTITIYILIFAGGIYVIHRELKEMKEILTELRDAFKTGHWPYDGDNEIKKLVEEITGE